MALFWRALRSLSPASHGAAVREERGEKQRLPGQLLSNVARNTACGCGKDYRTRRGGVELLLWLVLVAPRSGIF